MKRRNAIIGFIVGTVGFISAVVGLWPIVFPPTPDHEIKLVNNGSQQVIKPDTKLPTEKIIKADAIIIDGFDYKMQPDTMFLSNTLTMQNGGSISGEKITVISTQIYGGSIVSMKHGTLNGGEILIASAEINGTSIRASGLDGTDGKIGANGKNGVNGGNGRKGRCDGFGKFRRAKAGANGGNGADGQPGTDGQSGGHGGQVSIFYSIALTNEPVADAGIGGKGGTGGKGGAAGSGGAGGRGCTGLGGTQSNARNGTSGTPGRDGAIGKNGSNGNLGNVSKRKVAFKSVRNAIKKAKTVDDMKSSLDGISLKNS